MPDPTLDPEPITVPNDNPPPTYTPPDINMAEALPPEFRDKEYFKGKGFEDVIKDHVNLQTLLGQRPAGIPGEDASAEEWDKFLGAVRPKEATEYEFPETDFSKAGKRNEGYESAIREMATEVGIPKRQFSKFVEKIEGHLAAADQIGATQTEEQQKARDEEFEKMLDDTYKADKPAVIERTKKLMTDMVDPSMKEKVADVLKEIPNDALFALTAVLDGVHKKYVAEDSTPGAPSNVGGDATTLQSEAEKLMQSKAYNDFREPGHDAAKEQVREIFKQIASMGTKK